MRSVTIIVCVAGLLTASALAHAAPAHHAATAPHAATAFKLASPTIAPGSTLTDAQVANTFGCSGKNISPALTWSGAPAGTRSFAFTLYDPDAPTGSGWWHWVVYDIPATANGLLEGAGTADGARLPSGSKQGHTDFGTPGFGGACPPPGDKAHRYIFTVYALKVAKIEVPADASPAMIGAMIHSNQIASASFTAKYGRSK